jgi:hypothetical protein
VSASGRRIMSSLVVASTLENHLPLSLTERNTTASGNATLMERQNAALGQSSVAT